jgi:hypothetical protein
MRLATPGPRSSSQAFSDSASAKPQMTSHAAQRGWSLRTTTRANPAAKDRAAKQRSCAALPIIEE